MHEVNTDFKSTVQNEPSNSIAWNGWYARETERYCKHDILIYDTLRQMPPTVTCKGAEVDPIIG